MHYSQKALVVDFHEQRDGWTLKHNVMGCQADICVERILQSTIATGQNRSTTGRTDEPGYLPFSSSGARLFVLALPVPQDPMIPSLCCSESEDSVDGELNSEN